MTGKVLTLSYPLNRRTPLYPGTAPVTIETESFAEKGRVAITSQITINSHSGTHIDLPAHFLPDGLKADKLLEREMVLEPAYFLSLPKDEDQEVGPEGLEGIEEMDDAEALLIRTGFGKFRDGARDTYIDRHPWVSPELPKFLRNSMPRLRLFGIDVLSLAVPQRPAEGRDVHLGFLSNEPPTIIMEDVDLSDESLLMGKWRLRLYPWILDEIEGLPVTVLAERIE